MPQLSEFDYSPAAREIMREASRAGVSRESVGEWMAFARRYERLGRHGDAAECAARAIAIHETWGARHASYAMSEGTLATARALVALNPEKAA